LGKLWYKLVTLKRSPRKIAAGFAVGIFLSYTPTFGFQTVLAIGCATLLRINPVSAVVGVYLTNVFTVAPIYALCYNLGSRLLGSVPLQNPEQFKSWLTFLKLGPRVIGTEFLGGLLMGILTVAPAYFLALFGVIRYRRARLNRRIENMRKRIAGSRAGAAKGTGAPQVEPPSGRP
jgi:uncharacterized protein (DUF2062 family)